MPPRPRSSTPSNEEPPSNRPRVHQYSPLFGPEEGQAREETITLVSSDKISFVVPRAALALHSPVFRDMLEIPQAPAHEDEPAVVELAEGEKALVFFLRHVVPDTYFIDGEAPSFNFDDRPNRSKASRRLFAVLRMAHKYQAAATLDGIARIHLPLVNVRQPFTAWAAAVEFGFSDQARLYLKALSRNGHALEGAKKRLSSGAWLNGHRDVCLADLPDYMLENLPLSAIKSFCALHAKVVASQDGSYTWDDASREFSIW